MALTLVGGAAACGKKDETAVQTNTSEKPAEAPAVGGELGGLVGDIKPDETTTTAPPETTAPTTEPPVVVQLPPTTSGPRATVYVPPASGGGNTGVQPAAFNDLTADEQKVLAKVREFRGTANPEADLTARARSIAAAGQLGDPNILNNLQVRWKYVNQVNAYGGPTLDDALKGFTASRLSGPGSWVGIGMGTYNGQILMIVLIGDY